MKNFKKFNGFTLIELLVIIAIIGILATVTLTYLGGSRDKARDARIISNTKSMKTNLELGFNGATYQDLISNSSPGAAASNLADAYIYGKYQTCNPPNFGSSEDICKVLLSLENDTLRQGGSLVYVIDKGTSSRATAYAIYAKLVSTPGYFCVDSTGNVNKKSPTADTTACPFTP